MTLNGKLQVPFSSYLKGLLDKLELFWNLSQSINETLIMEPDKNAAQYLWILEY